MLAMISQPMGYIDESIILETKKTATEYLKSLGYDVLDTYFDFYPDKDVKNDGVFYLAKSLECLSKCDLLYMCKGWEEKNGCVIEHITALRYGIDIEYEGGVKR